MRIVVLQDGTNTIVKNKDKPIDEIFNEYQVLLDKVREKLWYLDILVAIEVTPMKNNPRNSSKNSKIQEFNIILRKKACSMGCQSGAHSSNNHSQTTTSSTTMTFISKTTDGFLF